MKLDQFILGILIFSVFLVGGVLVWGNTIDNYNINASTEDFGGVYDKINDTYDLSQEMKSHTLDGELEGGSESWESMAKGSYSAIRMVKNAFGLVGSIVNAVSVTLGIPAFFVQFAMIAMTIMIIFAIIYLVFRAG